MRRITPAVRVWRRTGGKRKGTQKQLRWAGTSGPKRRKPTRPKASGGWQRNPACACAKSCPCWPVQTPRPRCCALRGYSLYTGPRAKRLWSRPGSREWMTATSPQARLFIDEPKARAAKAASTPGWHGASGALPQGHCTAGAPPILGAPRASSRGCAVTGSTRPCGSKGQWRIMARRSVPGLSISRQPWERAISFVWDIIRAASDPPDQLPTALVLY